MTKLVISIVENVTWINGQPYTDLPEFIENKHKVFEIEVNEKQLKQLYAKRK